VTDTAQPFSIPLWPGEPPGSEGWHLPERVSYNPPGNVRVLRNVTRPSITVYLPDPAHATGTGVVVCPGGAFHFLADEHEGTQVAQWLNSHDVAVFVLRYRVIQTALDETTFRAEFSQRMSGQASISERFAQIRPLAVADGQQAMRIVRERAAEFGLAADRIGILGFSAGAVVTLGVALEHDAASRPSFAAPIYPAPWEDLSVPADAAPLFLALASDDAMAVGASLPIYSAWRDAGQPVELHVFAQGGHGFGMNKQDLPVDHWIELFASWLRGQGLLRRSAGA